MRNQETGLEYANTDPSLHFNSIERSTEPRWQEKWIELLQAGDYDAADQVYKQNMAHTDECLHGDHDRCHGCHCVCHSRLVLKAEGPQLRSCREGQSERDEAA